MEQKLALLGLPSIRRPDYGVASKSKGLKNTRNVVARLEKSLEYAKEAGLGPGDVALAIQRAKGFRDAPSAIERRIVAMRSKKVLDAIKKNQNLRAVHGKQAVE
ncbi:MAG: hypothetical protein V1676_05550 [Candidatus Diapherotrites archaeon]